MQLKNLTKNHFHLYYDFYISVLLISSLTDFSYIFVIATRTVIGHVSFVLTVYCFVSSLSGQPPHYGKTTTTTTTTTK